MRKLVAVLFVLALSGCGSDPITGSTKELTTIQISIDWPMARVEALQNATWQLWIAGFGNSISDTGKFGPSGVALIEYTWRCTPGEADPGRSVRVTGFIDGNNRWCEQTAVGQGAIICTADIQSFVVL